MSTSYAPSLEVAIHNALVSRIAALECPDRLISPTRAGAGSEFQLITEDQVARTSRPKSIEASPISEAWDPSRSCSYLARRKSYRWQVTVTFTRPVLTDRALEELMKSPEPTGSPDPTSGLALRLVSVDHTFRPLSSPEQGTAMRLVFEVLSHT